jgi:hypothetical protein
VETVRQPFTWEPTADQVVAVVRLVQAQVQLAKETTALQVITILVATALAVVVVVLAALELQDLAPRAATAEQDTTQQHLLADHPRSLLAVVQAADK